MPALTERDGIDARVRIRQPRQRKRRPASTAVGRPGLEYPARTGAADSLQLATGMAKNGGLYRINGRCGLREGGKHSGPGNACIGAPLEMNAPDARSLRRLGARRREDRPIVEPHRFVLDRTQYAVGESSGGAPGTPAVG